MDPRIAVVNAAMLVDREEGFRSNTEPRWEWRPVLARMAVLQAVACFGFPLPEGRPETPAPRWETIREGRWIPLDAGPKGVGFTRLPPSATGLRFTNLLTNARIAENQIRLNGSGLAAGDIDGDGWCDLYLCGMETPNALYRNLGGWQFEDITAKAGLFLPAQLSTGAVFADVDGDHDLDLLVNSSGSGSRLFINDGQGHFSERGESGLMRRFCATTCALADIDGDGDLDLYVGNYRTTTVRSTGIEFLRTGNRRVLKPEDQQDYHLTPEGRLIEHGEPDILYLNDGHGRFSPQSWTDGRFLDEDGNRLLAPPRDWTLSAMFRDLNQDGLPDLYVCGDFDSPDRVWLNAGHGRFKAIDHLALRTTSTFSMAVDVADIDRDGHDDIFVSDMLAPDHLQRIVETSGLDPRPFVPGRFNDRPQENRNTLQWNRGDGTYAEVSFYAGVEAFGWTWLPVFMDVDLDGYEDILVTTGHSFNTQDMDAEERIASMGPFPRAQVGSKVLLYPPLPQPRRAYRNCGGLTFQDMSRSWRFDEVGIAQGMALADLDGDGDLDVVVNQLNEVASVYRNDASGSRLAVRLRGLPPNTQGIGARIEVAGGPVSQSQEIIAGGHYLSGSEPLRVFAAPPDKRLRIEVTWPGGARTSVDDARGSRCYEVEQTRAAQPSPGPRSPIAQSRPLFEDASALLDHAHHEELFDDFARQPLLPRRLSQLGPGVVWSDLDGDGHEDLVVGAGSGGRLGVFRNTGRGGFESISRPPFDPPLARDSAGLIALDLGASRALLAGLSSYEDATVSVRTGAVLSLLWGAAGPVRVIDDSTSSSGPLAAADCDGDGDLDLFVGGRCIPGHYPKAATSRLFRQSGGRFELDAENSALFNGIGLVSGCVFSDLDGDGFPELLLACEWSPLRLLRNRKGRLDPWDPPVKCGPHLELRLSDLTGWWTGVATGDLNGDGRLDIVAANHGLNTPYRATRQSPRRLYYGDFAGSGGTELLEAIRDPGSGRWLADRDYLSVCRAIPGVRDRVPTHRAHGNASVDEILGEAMNQAHFVEANTLASVVLLNRGTHFELRQLPLEAQLAPAFAICVADFDGDGCEDVFLAQNCFSGHPFAPRADAGRGLVMLGDGEGGFRPLSALESGIRVYGEQRGAAVSDYDHDGRMDLVVTQNGAPTRLFHNVGGRPGITLILNGSPGNREAIGAKARLDFGTRRGATREVQAGSGYWSMNGTRPVLRGRGEDEDSPLRIVVQWPGGLESTRELARGAQTVALDQPPRADEP